MAGPRSIPANGAMVEGPGERLDSSISPLARNEWTRRDKGIPVNFPYNSTATPCGKLVELKVHLIFFLQW